MIDLTGVTHHPAMEDIVNVLCRKTQNTDKGFFRACVAYFFGKMAATMRAHIVTKDRGDIPVNVYTLALATSGYGKGYSVSVMEQEFLRPFTRAFLDNTFELLADQNLWALATTRAARNGGDEQEEYDRVSKEYRSAGAFPFTFDSGTPPAVKQLRHKLLLANCGAINLQIDEIGSNLVGNTEILTLFLELYDQGIVKPKLIKNTADNIRGEDIDGRTPTNMLLFGTPAKLLDGGSTEDNFYEFLQAGYARRCIFGWGNPAKKALNSQTAAEIYANLIQPQNSQTVNKWADHFRLLAHESFFNWRMEMPDDVAIKLLEYKINCERIADALGDHDEIKKAELAHRFSKAQKLAGAYAFIDQSVNVEMHHLLSAILLVEESGEAFQSILSRERAYEKLAKYVASTGTELTHADLHEALPYYKQSNAARNELMTLATAWGYKHHIIIKKTFVDNIEFFRGETLKETNLDEIILSYSTDFAYNYQAERVPFNQLHKLTQAPDMHWANHHFNGGHRHEDKTISGFNAIVLDVDNGTSLSTAADLMQDYTFLAHTTKRHTPEANRFRMILPINYELFLDTDEYKEFINTLLDWMPFASDPVTNQRCKKWMSNDQGAYQYNEGKLIDVLDFIPKTKKNENYKENMRPLESLDNLERWFANHIGSGNRNNQMLKYALALADSGMSLPQVRNQVYNFNKRLNPPLLESEIDSTILVTVGKRYQAAA